MGYAVDMNVKHQLPFHFHFFFTPILVVSVEFGNCLVSQRNTSIPSLQHPHELLSTVLSKTALLISMTIARRCGVKAVGQGGARGSLLSLLRISLVSGLNTKHWQVQEFPPGERILILSINHISPSHIL